MKFFNKTYTIKTIKYKTYFNLKLLLNIMLTKYAIDMSLAQIDSSII